ncbi:Multidrug resistance protein B [Pseudomonas aeruginosa]|nr:Multidrug resistance protein B [Pseudomonas aeruginosa]
MSESSSFSPPSLVMATIGLSLATFMQVLDTTIANVALPTISGNLGVSSEQGTWVITSFAVSNAIARLGGEKLLLSLMLAGSRARAMPRCCSYSPRSSAASPSRCLLWSASAPCRASSPGRCIRSPRPC